MWQCCFLDLQHLYRKKISACTPKTSTFPPKKLDASEADFGTGWEVGVRVVLDVPDVVAVVGAEEEKAELRF